MIRAAVVAAVAVALAHAGPANAATLPGAPTNVRATAGNRTATVEWTPPLSDGGDPIFGYNVRPFIGSAEQPGGTSVGANVTSAVVTGLFNGTTYTFKVMALNHVGPGPYSAPSNPVTPPGFAPPGPPRDVSAVAHNAAATIFWSPPADDGGGPITDYVVHAYVGTTLQFSSAPTGGVTWGALGGLKNGTAYTFTVSAINDAGEGQESAASNGVVPLDSPPPPPSDFDWPANPSVDFDGDNMTDLGGLYRARSPADSLWYSSSSSGGSPFQIFFGAAGDVPVPGDYDGDGRTDAVVFRPTTGLWYGPRTGAAEIAIQMIFGQAGDIPVPGDYDGDGRTDPAIFHPATGRWVALLSNGGVKTTNAFFVASTEDVPVPRDYDGDGKTDVAIYRQFPPDHPSVWYALLSTGGGPGGIFQSVFGLPGDIPVPGDYNGDGRAEAAIFRESTGLWYAPFNGAPGALQLLLGGPGDVPIPGYYDNDRTMDPAIYRKDAGLWFTLLSGGGTARVDGLGQPTDVPVQKRPALAGGL